MGKRDELIATYAEELKTKCGVTPDTELLTKVAIGLGPALYNADASTVAGTDPAELETIRKNFLAGKLGLPDGPELMQGIETVLDIYGKSERHKYRAVVYYLLVTHFGKQSAYA